MAVRESPAPATPAAVPPSRTAARTSAGFGLTVISCGMLFVSWQAFGNLWWLTFVALVPTYVAQYRLLSGRLAALALGLAYGAYWLALLLQGTSVLPAYVLAPAALIFVLLGWLAGLVLRPFNQRTGYRWFVVSLPLLWVGLDIAVQNNEIMGSYSWIAYRLADAPQLIQPVSLTSTPALSFLLLMLNSWIALLVLKAMDRRWPQLATVPVPARVLAWTSVVTVGLVLAWTASSLMIYSRVTSDMEPTVRVAAVQPSLANAMPGTLLELADDDRRTDAQRNADQTRQLSAMTRDAARQGAQLVVWPEEALDYDPRAVRTTWIPDLVRETGVYLVVGFIADPKNPASPNVALMYAPDGLVVGGYDKVHRVIAEGEAFEPGTHFPTMQTSLGPIGLIICFDIDFPDSSPRLVAQGGAQIIAAPSIDFASISEARIASTTFRAVENRVGFVKADVAWDSAIIAPNGQVLAGDIISEEIGGADLLVHDLPRGPLGAPFTGYGGTPFALVVAAGLVAMVIAMVLARRRSSRPDDADRAA